MNIKKLSAILVVFVFAALFAGSVFAEEPASLYVVDSWYYQLEFNDTTLQGSDFFTGDLVQYENWAMPEIVSYDGAGVAAFDSSRSGRVAFRLNNGTATYKKMKADFESGKELCIELKINYPESKIHEMNFFSRVLFNAYPSSRLQFMNTNNTTNIGSAQTGWNTISFVLFLDENDKISAKDVYLNGNLVADADGVGKVFPAPASFDTPSEFFTVDYFSKIVLHRATGDAATTYLDYMRIYSKKTLNDTAISIDKDKVSIDEDTVEITFDNPIDATTAATNVTIKNSLGNALDITSGVGSEANILSLTINEPLTYSGCYTISIVDLEDADKVLKFSKDIKFYVVNEPLYQFRNVNLTNKTVEVRNAIPVARTVNFVSQIYNSAGKLIDAEIYEASLDDSQEFKSVLFMTSGLASGASKVKIYVFDGNITDKNIYTVLEQSL